MSSFIETEDKNLEILTPKEYNPFSKEIRKSLTKEQINSQPTSTKNQKAREGFKKAGRYKTNDSYSESQLNGLITEGIPTFVSKRQFSNTEEIICALKNGEMFQCILCSTNPIENYCNVCEKAFCKKCISEWLSRNNSCPHCRYKRPIMEDVFEIAEIRKLQQRLFLEKIQCKHIDRVFKCKICKFMMIDPVSCSRCNHNYCKRCFQNHQIKENKCPQCNSHDPKLKSPHKSLLEILDRASVLCKYCKEPQKYHKLIDHEIICKQERIKKYRAYNVRRLSKTGMPPLNLSASKIQSFRMGQSNGNMKHPRLPNVENVEEIIITTIQQKVNTVSAKDNEKSDNSDNTANITFSNISDTVNNANNDISMQSFEQQCQSYNRERIRSSKQNGSNLNINESIQNQSQQDLIHASNRQNNGSSLSNPLLEKEYESSNSSPEQSNVSQEEEEYHEFASLEFYDEGILDGNMSPQIRESAARLRSSSEFKLRLGKEQKVGCFKELGKSLRVWSQTSRDNMDIDNCSSNSWSFYFMLFLVGSAEMFLTTCLFFGIYLMPLKDNQDPVQINHLIFAIAATIEITYLVFATTILSLIYIKTYGLYMSPCTNFWIQFPKSIISILPCEMLIFFGYDGNHTYEQVLLNLSWIRRVISSMRIIIQMLAFDSMINGDYVTLVSFANLFYLTLLLVAICPQSSSYDQFSWYRRI